MAPSGNERSLGSAQWLPQDTAAARFPYVPGMVWLGRAENGTALGYGDDRHVCLVSGSRGGKGATCILNTLCHWPGSVVVIDPKGENATVAAARRGAGSADCAGLGQALHVLDPFETARIDGAFRSSFNPVDALDPRSAESVDEAARLAAALVVPNDKVADPYFDDAARNMLKVLLLHIATAKHFEGERNLLTLRKLVTAGNAELLRYLRDRGEDHGKSAQELLWMEVSDNRAFGGVVAGLGSTYLDLCRQSSRTWESVRQTALVNTEFLDSPAMARCLRSSDFELSELKTRPGGVSLFLSLPQRFMSTHHRWLRMMVTLILAEMERVPGQPVTGHRVLLLLDEFASMKRLEAIENAVDKIAGYGVKLFFVLQSLEQLKGTYDNRWETFLANASLKIFFSIEDHFTREYVSKLVGETEVVKQARSATETWSATDGTSETEGTNLGWSTSRTRSDSAGTSHSHSSSHSESWNRPHPHAGGTGSPAGSSSSGGSQTSGSSTGWSSSATEQSSSGTSSTRGSSHALSRGGSNGATESFHVRPLLAPDEVGREFARVDDRSSTFHPGRALVLIAGVPLVVRRVNYYEDRAFFRQFSPHPDHPVTFVREEPLGIGELLQYLDFMAVSGHTVAIHRHVGVGSLVDQGMPLISFHTAIGNGGATLRAPRLGVITQFHPAIDRGLPALALTPRSEALVSLLSPGGEPDGPSPFAELAQLCAYHGTNLHAQSDRDMKTGLAATAVLGATLIWMFMAFSWWALLPLLGSLLAAFRSFGSVADAMQTLSVLPPPVPSYAPPAPSLRRIEPAALPAPAPAPGEHPRPAVASAGPAESPAVIACPSCAQRNRVPSNLERVRPVCGRCKQPLFAQSDPS